MAHRGSYDYHEDMFADTRMSFGEHIEELRSHMLRAIYGFLTALVVGFFVAPYVLDVIQAPVREQLREFHAQRFRRKLHALAQQPDDVRLKRPRVMPFTVLADEGEVPKTQAGALPTYRQVLAQARLEVARAEALVQDQHFEEVAPAAARLRQLADALAHSSAVPEESRANLPALAAELGTHARELEEAGHARDAARADQTLLAAEALLGGTSRTLWLRMKPVEMATGLQEVLEAVDPRDELVSLSILESCMAYLKVSIVCGLVLASPWIFYQMWSFVAAGLYPHERRYVNVYLPVSIVLFLAGLLLAQFFMMPKIVEVLLWFNRWLGQEPVLRLSDWLTFALIVPALTGLCFELPLVMLFLERIGLVTVQGYVRHWKAALFIVHVIAAVGPAVDPISMEIVALPMFALYWLGILMCRLRPSSPDRGVEAPEPGEPVEV